MRRTISFVVFAMVLLTAISASAWTQVQVHFLGQIPRDGLGVPLLLRTNWTDSSDAYAEADPQGRHNLLFVGGGLGYQAEDWWFRAMGGPGLLAVGRQSIVGLATGGFHVGGFIFETEWEGVRNNDSNNRGLITPPVFRQTTTVNVGYRFKELMYVGAVGSYYYRSGPPIMYYQPSTNMQVDNPDWYNNPVSQKGNEIYGVGGKLAYFAAPDSHGRAFWEMFLEAQYLMAEPDGWTINQPNGWRETVRLKEERQQRLAANPAADTSDLHPENGAVVLTLGIKFNLGVDGIGGKK